MIKKCAHCGAEFTAAKDYSHQRFCSEPCRQKNRRDRKRRFEREWAAWLRDFAAGKTQSNIKEATDAD